MVMFTLQVVIAGHINAVYQHLSHFGQVATPSKRTQSSQSQVSSSGDLKSAVFTWWTTQVTTTDAATMATLVTFCQHRITNELTEQLYMWVTMDTNYVPKSF